MCFIRTLLYGFLIMLININFFLLDGNLAFVHKMNQKTCQTLYISYTYVLVNHVFITLHLELVTLPNPSCKFFTSSFTVILREINLGKSQWFADTFLVGFRRWEQ